MSHAPIKPRAKKALEPDAGAPKPTPRKRSPKRAVAVDTDKEAMAPGHASALAVPVKLRGTTRKKMVEAQNALHETLKQAEKQSMRKWEEKHFPYDEPDYAAESKRNRQDATDMWITVATVFGVIVIIAIMAWWVV